MKIPKELDEIIMKCLAAKVEDRYQRPFEILRALSEIRGEKHHKSELEDILGRIRAREQASTESCWNCRRSLPLRAEILPVLRRIDLIGPGRAPWSSLSGLTPRKDNG